MTAHIETVAVGYDGSVDSEIALRWAAALCASLGTRLKIVHAVGLLEESGFSTALAPSPDRALKTATDAGLEAQRVEWLALEGAPADVLLRTTMLPDAADLLVVGTRGMAAHAGVILGSTSLAVAERSPVPVVIVPAAR
jgi:nucleotide-binding universal stress UspA family protein